MPRRPLTLAAVVLLLVCVAVVPLWVRSYWVSNRFDRDVVRLNDILSSLSQADPAYADLKVIRSTHPKAWVFGTVDSPPQVDAVRAKIAEAFGAEEARRIVSPIRLRLSATRPSGG